MVINFQLTFVSSDFMFSDCSTVYWCWEVLLIYDKDSSVLSLSGCFLSCWCSFSLWLSFIGFQLLCVNCMCYWHLVFNGSTDALNAASLCPLSLTLSVMSIRAHSGGNVCFNIWDYVRHLFGCAGLFKLISSNYTHFTTSDGISFLWIVTE